MPRNQIFMTACFITYFEMSMRPKNLAVVDLNLQISAGQAHSHTKKTGCLALNFFSALWALVGLKKNVRPKHVIHGFSKHIQSWFWQLLSVEAMFTNQNKKLSPKSSST